MSIRKFRQGMIQMTEINQEFIEQSVKKLDKADIALSAIPTFPLYMEQMRQFINHEAGGAKRKDTEENISDVFSKAMINNYTKVGLLNPPENKKYNRDHILMLLLINQLKNVLAINDIKLLFEPILDLSNPDIKDDIISIEDIYDTFLKIKDDEYRDAGRDFAEKFKIIKEKTQHIADDDKQDLAEDFLIVMMLVAEANIAKRLAEDIIDEIFKKRKAIKKND